MKRRTLKSIACAAIMALALSATACGAKDAAKTEDKAAVEDAATTEADAPEADAEVETPEADTEADAPEADVEAEKPAADDAGSTEGYSTLEDYYSDPTVKSALDSALGAMGGDGMALTIDVKENTLTMICKFEDSSVVVDGVGDALLEALETQAATFETQAKTFDDAIGQAGACTVVVRYTDPDDNVLAEKEFKAQ